MTLDVEGNLQEVVNLFWGELESDGEKLQSQFLYYNIHMPHSLTVLLKKVKLYYNGNETFVVAGGRVSGNLYIVIGHDSILEELKVYIVDGSILNTKIGSMSDRLKSTEFWAGILRCDKMEDVDNVFRSSSKAIFLKDNVDDQWVEDLLNHKD